MTFNEFIEKRIKEANDYGRDVSADEIRAAEEAWKAGKAEAAEHIIALWVEPWIISRQSFSMRLLNYVEGLK